MASLSAYLLDFKHQLHQGKIIKAYQGLLDYIRSLRSYFQKNHPEWYVPGNIYYGYLDMTYFALIPESLKDRQLKIAVVFNYDTFSFEAWLSGANREVQSRIWNIIRASGWDPYPLAADPKKEDHIIRCTLVEDPDFNDLVALTQRIDGGIVGFIQNVEAFLADH